MEPKGKGRKSPKRAEGHFVRLPTAVLMSPGYRALSHTARSLLTDIAMQYKGSNNGALVACENYLQPRGWNSKDVISRALRELQECGLLVKTRQGGRHLPNLFAIAFNDLDKDERHDPQMVLAFARLRENYKTYKKSLTPRDGPTTRSTGPSRGEKAALITPCNGLIAPQTSGRPTPSDGRCLEVTICPEQRRAIMEG